MLIGGFAVLGYLALQKHLWAFAVGLTVYGLDGLTFLAARNGIGLGFHVFVLVMVFKGLQAARQLDTVVPVRQVAAAELVISSASCVSGCVDAACGPG